MDDEIDLRQYLNVLWRRRNTIAAVTLAAVLAAGLSSFLSPPVYESEAIIQLSEHSAPIYASPSSAAQVLTTPSFLDAVAKTSAVSETGRGLRKLVKVEPVRDTRMIRLKVRYRDGQQTQRLSNAIAQAFISKASERVEEKRKATKARLDSVNAQLAEIQRILRLTRGTLSRLQQGGKLTGEERGFVRSFTLNAMSVSEALYSELRVAQRGLTSELLTLEPPALIEPPSVPLEPVARRKIMNTILAAILGLMAGTMLAFVMEYFRASAPAPIASSAAPVTPNPYRRKELEV